MKKVIVIFHVLLFGVVVNSENYLKNYLLDDTDLAFANYTLLKTENMSNYTFYTFNMTSLKWFNGIFTSL